MGYKLRYNTHMERERKGIDRRTALLFGLDAVLGGGIAVWVGRKLQPYLGLLSEPEPGSIGPDDLKRVFVTSDTDISLEDGHKKASLNKDVFAQALYDVSSFMDPKAGPEKLYSVLARKPLIVRLSPLEREIEVVRGEALSYYGNYESYFKEGPWITFYPEELTGYYRALKNVDTANQKVLDEYVWHEIVHLVQELRNPLVHWDASLRYQIKEVGYDLGFGNEPDFREKSNEVEAREISVAISKAKLYGTEDLEHNWPFGKFFIFNSTSSTFGI